MTTEEKAKAYDEVLKVANNELKVCGTFDCDCARQIFRLFPELKENKEPDDERVRKGLIELVKQSSEILAKKNQEHMIAWIEKQAEHANFRNKIQIGDKVTKNRDGYLINLSQLNRVAKVEEKQGEQKPAEVESKFKVGDWVVNKGHSYLIADIDFLDNRYLFEIGGYTHEQLNWEYIENVDNKYHLWTIQDAKDGDVLMSRAPFIYGKPIPYGGLDWYNGKFIKASNYVFKDSPVYPATKEQRDLLFQKMKEAGYEFDFEKKELKKIEQKPTDEEMKTLLRTEYEKGLYAI